jgi:hypothetical protein
MQIGLLRKGFPATALYKFLIFPLMLLSQPTILDLIVPIIFGK